MKNFRIILIAALAFIFFTTDSNAQVVAKKKVVVVAKRKSVVAKRKLIVAKKKSVVVKKRMLQRHLVVYRTPRPSEKHFWVSGEWVPKGHTYVEVPAHWAIAPHPHALWVPGEWRPRKGGYVWLPGMWK